VYVGSEYIAAAENAGFELLEQIDITPETLPTLEIGRDAYHAHLVPAAKLVSHFVNHTPRWKMMLLRPLIGGQVRRLARIREFMERRLDAECFERYVSYQRLLFRKKAPIS
jgi:hypothetical protein